MESLPFSKVFAESEDSKLLASKLGFFPYVAVSTATLAGHSSLHVRVSLDPRDQWVNGIYFNSRHSIFTIRDGKIEQIARHYDLAKFRKSKIKSLDDAAFKLKKWFNSH